MSSATHSNIPYVCTVVDERKIYCCLNKTGPTQTVGLPTEKAPAPRQTCMQILYTHRAQHTSVGQQWAKHTPVAHPHTVQTSAGHHRPYVTSMGESKYKSASLLPGPHAYKHQLLVQRASSYCSNSTQVHPPETLRVLAVSQTAVLNHTSSHAFMTTRCNTPEILATSRPARTPLAQFENWYSSL